MRGDEHPRTWDTSDFPEDAALDRALAWGAVGLVVIAGAGVYAVYRLLVALEGDGVGDLLTWPVLGLVVAAPFAQMAARHYAMTDLRDAFLQAVVWLAAAALVVVSPALGLWLALAALRWRDHTGLPELVIVASLTAVVLGAWAAGPGLREWVTVAIVGAALIHVTVSTAFVADAWRKGWTFHECREQAGGLLGHRVVFGILSAIALPLAPGWVQPALGWGVVLSQSWIAAGALAVGLVVRWPDAWPVVLACGGIAWWILMAWRGHPRDSVRQRLIVWAAMARVFVRQPRGTQLLGLGRKSFKDEYARYWDCQGLTAPTSRFHHAHNDYLQFVFERGWIGAGVLGLAAVQVGRHAAWGDPVTAALAVAATAAIGHATLAIPQTGVPVLVLGALLAAGR